MALQEEQITESDFTVELITMRSKKSFAEVTAEVERLFQPYDLDKLSNLAPRATRRSSPRTPNK